MDLLPFQQLIICHLGNQSWRNHYAKSLTEQGPGRLWAPSVRSLSGCFPMHSTSPFTLFSNSLPFWTYRVVSISQQGEAFCSVSSCCTMKGSRVEAEGVEGIMGDSVHMFLLAGAVGSFPQVNGTQPRVMAVNHQVLCSLNIWLNICFNCLAFYAALWCLLPAGLCLRFYVLNC